jgi:transcriptional regulator with XRE-family HTH domain
MVLKHSKQKMVGVVGVDDVFTEIKRELMQYDIESVSNVSGVHISTIYHWLEGRTKHPRIDTLTAVAESIGYMIVLQLHGGGSIQKKRHLRLV